jgi:cytochrome c6
MMKKATILVTCMILALACSAFAADGAATYKAKCAMCHGPNGVGDTPVGKSMGIKDLGSPAIQAKTDAVLAGLVSNGINKMPAFKSSLSQAQIDDVVKFLRTFKK